MPNSNKKKTALEKRIKRKITGREHIFFAPCTPGFRQLCYRELSKIGFDNDHLKLVPGGIEFSSKPDRAMLACLSLRSPLRILMRIGQFKASSFDALKKKLDNIDWSVILPGNFRLKTSITCKQSRLYHTDAITERVTQIIHNHLNPEAGLDQDQCPELTIYIRAEKDRFTISLDLIGSPLFKRGVKKQVIQAPLRENMAFAMLKAAKFSKDDILLDPMCGSGTFTIEAAMVKCDIPPGFFRDFAFLYIPGFSRKTFLHQKKETEKNISIPENLNIFPSDLNEQAVTVTRENLKIYKFTRSIDVRKKDFFSLNPNLISPGKKGLVVINPPYGKRIEQNKDGQNFYKEIQKKLENDFKGWRAAMILPTRKDMRSLNLPLHQIKTFHGGLEAVIGVGKI